MQSISLGGTHIAAIDEATGKLTIFDAQLLMEIPADEAYNLLVWLHDYHRERLHRLSHQDEKER